jgi:hypothetical protein
MHRCEDCITRLPIISQERPIPSWINRRAIAAFFDIENPLPPFCLVLLLAGTQVASDFAFSRTECKFRGEQSREAI